ncbi:MAG: tRNA (adenosine(37)-N6)-threonylcarbamoyltransferase complex dimerization subunit type 1 TsaB [Gemmatimonadales bacterium]|nr:tRNA (adenosine(37)-N6)-threonylcarbamoyltransferase complex dimerization subunit type 1 TsaB [Gemmatimonadales bacterium]
MWLAIDSAWGIGSVALGRPAETVPPLVETMRQPRTHASGLLPLIDAMLAQARIELAELKGVVIGDGPGSFTGLRIGASVAKALVDAHGVELWTAPSLMAMALTASSEQDAAILPVADALRGDLYCGLYRFGSDRVVTEHHAAVRRPDAIVSTFPIPKVMVGEAPEPARRALCEWAGCPVTPPSSRGAGALLDLIGLSGGARRIPHSEVSGWEPDYGRPAEAQAKWERVHGRPLADPPRADR